jgi:toxin YoeB
MKINFTETGWRDYLYWENQDKKTLKKINDLIEDITRNGYDGIGKPEALRGNLSGWWSRRIDEKNRLIYRLIENEAVEILQCRDHYSDK